MSFESLLKNDAKKDINKDTYKHNFKERVHMSKSKMDQYSNSAYLNVGESKYIHYKDETETRYVAAPNLTYDTAISIYDVNNRKLFVYRVFRYDKVAKGKIADFIALLEKGKPNMEARIIGMQNTQEGFSAMLEDLVRLFMDKGIKLVEVDIFGANTRHVAFDAKLGTTYNILLEDRIYRPGELINKMTIENFETSLKKQENEKWKS